MKNGKIWRKIKRKSQHVDWNNKLDELWGIAHQDVPNCITYKDKNFLVLQMWGCKEKMI